jgi:dienelactone hydrolase
MFAGKTIVAFAVAMLTVAAFVAAAAASSPEERAREAAGWLVNEQYQALWDASTTVMQKRASVEDWKTKAGPAVKAFGKLIEFGPAKVSQAGGNTIVTLPAKFENAAVDFTVSVDAEGKIAGLFLRPHGEQATAYQRPAYVKPESFAEREVTVGDGEWKLPGTLLLPKSAQTASRVPAVVLVHGSGPNDRDETISGNKPFKDLAEGLASQGIAVLRYDKRTKVYGAQIAGLKQFTVKEETIDDAVQAVALLEKQPEIDPKRVFVLGHSLGGYLLPMILESMPDARGGIALAGSTRPLEDIMVEQYEELIPEQTAGGSEELKQKGQATLEQARQARAAIKALDPSKIDGPPLLYAPPSYWLALAGYNPPARAVKFSMPLLILQGERDYQVKMTEFTNWKAALGSRPNVTLKSYPALNHLFIEGTGKSTPEEYNHPGHVSAEVISDIAKWIARH